MKKFSLILALLAALSFVFIGCPDGGGGGGGKKETKPFTHNLGSRTLDLADNYEYGKGYQGVATWTDLFKGEKVTAGEDYTLRITFTASRNLTDLLYVGLVDPTPEAGYWKPLTWAGDPSKPALIAGSDDDQIILQGEEISVEIKMKAIQASTAATAAANALVFVTDCTQGTPGTANSGVLGKITLTFSEVIFARGDIEGNLPPPPPPPPPLPDDVFLLEAAPDSFTGAAQGGWEIKSLVANANKLPTYLLVSVSGGGDGLGGSQAVINSGGSGWKQTVASPGWSFDGSWASPAKVFIVDLTLCDGYDSVGLAESYFQVGFIFNNAANCKLTLDRLTGAAIVFDGDGADAIYALCTTANQVSNGASAVIMWAVDADSIAELF